MVQVWASCWIDDLRRGAVTARCHRRRLSPVSWGQCDERSAMTEEFHELRPSAFAIAYRMLGSVSEAEDVVQEGFLRLHRAREGGERIEAPHASLSTVVSRLALDQLRSARAQREIYVGEW